MYTHPLAGEPEKGQSYYAPSGFCYSKMSCQKVHDVHTSTVQMGIKVMHLNELNISNFSVILNCYSDDGSVQ